MLKPIRNLIGTGIIALLTVAAIGLARFLPDFWFSFYTDFSRKAMVILGAATGWVPVCLWQILAVLLVLAVPVSFISAVRRKRILGWATGLLEAVTVLCALFVGLWGLNHFAPAIGSQTGLEVRPYSAQELEAATRWYAEQAGFWSSRVERDAEGNVTLPAHETLSRLAVESYQRLAEQNDRFSGTAPSVKPLFVSEGFSYAGTTGVFLCLTGEASVNTDAFPLTIPFTMCHELGHSLAVAAEDQANYCGYLACTASDSSLLRYSGYFTAFQYCIGALRREDSKAADGVWADCPEQVVQDAAANAAHNRKYEGKVQEAVQRVNNGYLKAFNHPEGVKSYGLVVDYLIAEYQKNN